MRNEWIREPVSCGIFRDFVFHLQAGELVEPDRKRMHDHLDACPPCARYLELEQSFAVTLQARIPRTTPPEGLEDRVRFALAEHCGAARAIQSRAARTWLWGMGAAAVVVLALVPLARVLSGPHAAAAEHVIRTAVLVDEDCDRAGLSVAEQRLCANASHLNALKLDDGSYWSLSVESAAARRLVADAAQRGRRLLVEGDFYPQIRTLHLTREPSTAALAPDFPRVEQLAAFP